MADGTEFVGSHEKANNGYGQNGDPNPSSATDLKNLPAMNRDFGLSADPSADAGNWQTRNVSKEGYAPANGMKAPAEPAKVPTANVRRASTRALGASP